MRDVLNPTTVKNTIGFLRNHDDKVILVLEGDSDNLALRDFIDRSSCRPLVAYGKVDAIEAVEWSDIQQFSGVLAVVDSDFVDMVEQRSASLNVIYTDNYDLDAFIFFSRGAVERCVEHLCSFDRFTEADGGEAHFRQLRARAAAMARLIACFRLYSMQDRCEISFDKFPFGEVYRGDALVLDESKLRTIMIGKLKMLPDPEAVLASWLSRADVENAASERIVQGHDLFRCFSLIVAKVHGKSHQGDLWEKMARSHFTIENLRSADFHAAVAEWCNKNGKVVWI